MTIRSKRLLALTVLTTSLLTLSLISQALASEPTGKYGVFKQCPRFTAGVNLCLYSQTLSGEVTLNKQTVPITKTITLQGGIALNEETFAEKFVGALNGETLSRTGENVPGGLAGLINCTEITGEGTLEVLARAACKLVFENKTTGVEAVTELAKPASEIGINSFNLESEEGTALSLPIKVKLENAFLGTECYIGSSADPITLTLTTGTTSPAPPNTPIKGNAGFLKAEDEFNFIELTNNKLVSNEFSAPEATGCGGIFSALLDPLIDSKIGLPSPDGYNTAIQNNTIKEATSEAVIASE